MHKRLILLAPLFFVISSLQAQNLDASLQKFNQIYRTELGQTQPCERISDSLFRVCSTVLKNEGNAPYILHHGKSTEKVVVLFHGLSDSPFFFKSIASAIFEQGNNVVVALLPGHGKKDADADMQDPALAIRWQDHVRQVMASVNGLGKDKYIGGFSTGGALATQYVLSHPDQAKGLLLYSGALALDSGVETLAGIWGIKWLTKTMDGEYLTSGPNPYKYPGVASYSAVQLADVIFDVRERLKQSDGFNLPVFVAHSKADVTTLFSGVESLMAANKGDNTLFAIAADLAVCHADLVVSKQQLQEMHYDKSHVSDNEACSVPSANPKHPEMLVATLKFLQNH
jgi:pimeloyl-ACP methyl ester carboxylesterase